MIKEKRNEDLKTWTEEKGFGRHEWSKDQDLGIYRIKEVKKQPIIIDEKRKRECNICDSKYSRMIKKELNYERKTPVYQGKESYKRI